MSQAKVDRYKKEKENRKSSSFMKNWSIVANV